MSVSVLLNIFSKVGLGLHGNSVGFLYGFVLLSLLLLWRVLWFGSLGVWFVLLRLALRQPQLTLTHYVASDRALPSLLPPPPKCWDKMSYHVWFLWSWWSNPRLRGLYVNTPPTELHSQPICVNCCRTAISFVEQLNRFKFTSAVHRGPVSLHLTSTWFSMCGCRVAKQFMWG